RAASRLASSDEDWKEEDPNLPRSPWGFTTDPAQGIGFRLVEPLAVPDKQTKEKVWEIDADPVRWDVEDRLEEGRGVKDNIHPALPRVIEQLEKLESGSGK
ncbi:MAG: formylglycine-generating enzyme family protein, partial [Pirellulales bacterium]|nr:formylglycine-generating enzyme family protein [Pirellulales bacterium]